MPVTDTGKRGPLIAIAVFKLFKAALLLVVAVGVQRLLRPDAAATLVHWAHGAGAEAGDRWVREIIARVTGLDRRQIEAISLGLVLYAALFTVEGIGLLMRKRWAEYLTVISTALLLPLEIWEVIKKPHATRVLVLVANVLIVIYLIVRLWRGRGLKSSS